MMWNYLVSGLLVGATPVLFDGDPGWPGLDALWRMAADERVTFFGTSAPFLLACRKEGVVPRQVADLAALRSVGSTGAPLPVEGFEWVVEAVGDDVLLSSVSGGTDVCTAFVGGCPLVPVRAGEISCRYLGAKVEAVDEAGRPVVGEQGELVISAPMPSMPVGFWGDDDGSRYRAAYFDDHPGVWTHGDWITVFPDGASVITGRSDATLNRGGVRMGTAELYAVVESLPEVADSLIVHLEDGEGGPGRLLLFVAPAAGAAVDDDLRARIARALRTQLSPRHVPDEIRAVPGVPRTLSGKKLEVPVKRILAGADPDTAASRGQPRQPRGPRRLPPGLTVLRVPASHPARQWVPSRPSPRHGVPGAELIASGLGTRNPLPRRLGARCQWRARWAARVPTAVSGLSENRPSMPAAHMAAYSASTWPRWFGSVDVRSAGGTKLFSLRIV